MNTMGQPPSPESELRPAASPSAELGPQQVLDYARPGIRNEPLPERKFRKPWPPEVSAAVMTVVSFLLLAGHVWIAVVGIALGITCYVLARLHRHRTTRSFWLCQMVIAALVSIFAGAMPLLMAKQHTWKYDIWLLDYLWERDPQMRVWAYTCLGGLCWFAIAQLGDWVDRRRTARSQKDAAAKLNKT